MKVVSDHQYIVHIIIAMAGMGFCLGITDPLLEVFLHSAHFDDFSISTLIFIEAVGFLCMAPFVPGLVKKFDHNSLLLAGLFLIGIVFFLLPYNKDFIEIFALRFFMGMGKALVFIVAATLINLLASKNHKGALIGFFAASFFAADGVAPLFLSVLPYRIETVSIIIILLMILCVIPLVLYKCRLLKFRGEVSISHAQLLLGLPSIIIITITQSLNQTAFQDSFTLYALEMGVSESLAMLLNTVILLGGVFLCGFASILLDKYRYDKVALLLVGISFIVYIILYTEQPHIYNSWLGLFFLGGTTLSLYMVVMIVLGRTYKGIKLAGAFAGFLIVSTVSQAVGELLMGATMQKWGANIFPLLMMGINGFCFFSYVFLLIYKKIREA